MKLQLFPEQQQVVDDVAAAFRAGHKRVMVSAFCGFGKTELATAMLQATADNGKCGAFLADRIALVEQTSARFDKYGLDHGVVQAQHWRYRPSANIQVCSTATLIRRSWPRANLLFIDEAHLLSQAVKKKLAARDCYVVALSATPITRGLGLHFDCVVNAPPANELIAMGRLVPLTFRSFDQPDMQGVEISSTGEWAGEKAEERVMQVVGDVVQTYLQHGRDRKFIGFAWSIAHAHEMQRQFLAAGINCGIYTSDEEADDRAEVLAELKRPDSNMQGVWSVAALTRGFDQTDIELMIDARPLRNAAHEYIQMLGRIMRSHDGKTGAEVFDHSGNALHFWRVFQRLFKYGVTELDMGLKKEADAGQSEDDEPEPMKCPTCKHMHPPRPICPHCGHEYPKKGAIEHVPGTLKELIELGDPGMLKRELWPQVVALVLEKDAADPARAQRRAQAIYHELTGKFAPGKVDSTEPAEPTLQLRNKVKANAIRYAKGKQAEAKRARAQGAPA